MLRGDSSMQASDTNAPPKRACARRRAVPAEPRPRGHVRQSPEPLGLEALREGIPPSPSAVRRRNLSSPRDAELLTKRVRMRLRGARRDSEALADFVVRASCRNELDHLPLALGDRRSVVTNRAEHGRDANSGSVRRLLTEGRIRTGYAAGSSESLLPAAFAARASSRSSAPIRSRSSNSSRRCVRIISGPSVAIVKATPESANARTVA